ncbi:hypothetical protein YC2023_050064 [Brassica napus]
MSTRERLRKYIGFGLFMCCSGLSSWPDGALDPATNDILTAFGIHLSRDKWRVKFTKLWMFRSRSITKASFRVRVKSSKFSKDFSSSSTKPLFRGILDSNSISTCRLNRFEIPTTLLSLCVNSKFRCISFVKDFIPNGKTSIPVLDKLRYCKVTNFEMSAGNWVRLSLEDKSKTLSSVIH